MNNPVSQPARRVGLTIWMIVSQLLTLGSLGFWLILAVVPIVFQDDPHGLGLSGWLLVLTIWAYPIFPIGMWIAAWIAFARRRNRLALWLSVIVTISILLILCMTAVASSPLIAGPSVIHVTPFP